MRDFGTGTEIVVDIVRIPVVDIELLVVKVEVDLRNIAITKPRTRYIA